MKHINEEKTMKSKNSNQEVFEGIQLESKGLLNEFLKYVSLNVLGMIALSLYILADTYFISQGIGPNGLTALNLALPIYTFIHGAALMISIGGATKFSIFKSQGNQIKASKSFWNSIYLVIGFSIIFYIIGFFFLDEIIRFFGADDSVFEMTKTYGFVLLLFSPMFIMNTTISSFVRNNGSPKLAMIVMVIGSFSNIILDYIFIFPLEMGIFGAVLATGFSPVISLSIFIPYMIKHKESFKKFNTDTKNELISMSKSILSNGFPSLVTEVSGGVVMIVFNMIILHLAGNLGIAAYGVIANISMVIMSIYTGIAQGVQPLLSRNFGKGMFRNNRKLFKYAVFTVLIFSVLNYIAIFFVKTPIVAAFNNEANATLQAIAENGMIIYFIGSVFAGLNIVTSIKFTSTENALPAQIISLLRGFIVILPLAFLLSWLFNMNGVWAAFPVTEILVGIVSLCLYNKYFKKEY